MISARSALLGLLLLMVPALLSSSALAQAAGPQPLSVDLMTVEPGQVYWQRFGHNALIIGYSDGRRVSYNFGYFDFDQPGFLLRFLRGHMLYRALALDADSDVAGYLEEGRAVRLQRLLLPAAALASLDRSLREHVQPQNSEYRYDYYRNNCSTKVRDALDAALGGQLKRETAGRSRGLSYRDYTLVSTAPEWWLYAGTHLGLGQAVDRPISLWDEQFLPSQLAERVSEMRLTNDAGGSYPLVVDDQVLGGAWPTLGAFPERWPWWLALGLLWAVLLRLPGRAGAVLRATSGAVWGIVGLGLLGLSFTDHWAAHRNENLILLSPLWLLTLPALYGRGGGLSRRALTLALLLAALGLALKVLPALFQQNWEWFYLCAPPMVMLWWRTRGFDRMDSSATEPS